MVEIGSDTLANKPKPVGLDVLISQLGINSLIGLLSFLMFLVLRPRNGIVYARRYKYTEKGKQLPKPDTRLFSWVKPLIKIREEELFEKIGLDAIMFLKFLKFCFRISLITSILGIVVLFPINFYAKNSIELLKTVPFDLSWLTLSVGFKNFELIWVHVILSWLFSFLYFYYIKQFYEDYLNYKKKFFSSPDYQNSINSRTLIAFNLPKTLRDDDQLNNFINLMNLPYSPYQVVIGRQVGNLNQLIEDHEKSIRNFERSLTDYLTGPEIIRPERPTMKLGGPFGKNVDAIDYYTQQIQDLEYQIQVTKERLMNEVPTNFGFLLFDKPVHAHLALRYFSKTKFIQYQGKKISAPPVSLAPETEDILWKNVQLSIAKRNSRNHFGRFLFVLFCLLGSIPVILFVSVANPYNIESLLKIPLSPYFRTFLQTFFAPLIFAIFTFLIPFILRGFSRYQGDFTRTLIEKSLLKKYYIFQFINSVLVWFLVQTIWNVIERKDLELALNSLKALPVELTNGLIQTSTYWTSFVSLKGMSSLIELSQAISLVIIFVKKYLGNPTPREKIEFLKPPDFPYGINYGLYIFVFTIAFMYSIVSPIISPFAMVNFALSFYVYKYQLMYVYATKVETGGLLWNTIIQLLFITLFIFQLLSGYVIKLSTFDQSLQWMSMIPLPILTVLFGIYYRFKVLPQNILMKDLPEYHEFHPSPITKEELFQYFTSPQLLKPLMKPMVDPQLFHLLPKSLQLDPTSTYESSRVDSHQENHSSASLFRSRTLKDGSMLISDDVIPMREFSPNPNLQTNQPLLSSSELSQGGSFVGEQPPSSKNTSPPSSHSLSQSSDSLADIFDRQPYN